MHTNVRDIQSLVMVKSQKARTNYSCSLYIKSNYSVSSMQTFTDVAFCDIEDIVISSIQE